jgi:iron complex transport system substrate-binding protein
MRIVSLLASSTEIICSLGLEQSLVGRSHECDFPPSVQSLPACSEPKIDIHASAKEIDRQVKEVVRDALSVYRVDADRLKALKPDLIVTQDQCEVCAVSIKDVERAVCHWLENKPSIVTLRPENLNGIWDSMTQVGEAAGVGNRARALMASLKQRMRAITEKVPVREPRLKAACIEWIDPLMAAGNWVPEMVNLLGADHLFGKAGEHSPWMTFDDLREADPDIIMVMPCGWDMNRSREAMPVLESQTGWNDLKAVKTKQVYLTDGNQYFNRPGPRIVESLEIMAEIFYPQTFRFGHEHQGWQKF